MSELQYCKRCLEPTTRPDSMFNDDGICFPCEYHVNIDRIDWAERRRELDKIVAWGREHNISGYDCIVPVSGGKDSTRQAIFLRDELGMRPLLVSVSYPPEQQTERGANNLANLIQLGFDCYVVSPGPKSWKELMVVGFRKFGHIYKSTELALYAAVPKFAIMYKIPLIVYGENPAISWGSAGGSLDGDANRMKYSNTLKGGDITPYVEDGYSLTDLYWYRYPPDEDIARANLQMIYLGYYIPDFNDHMNAKVAMENGLEVRKGEDAVAEDIGQVFPWDALDDDFVHVNQMLKYLKMGFGKASEQCSGAIRNGHMSRDEAIALAEKYDGKVADRYVNKLCNYFEISTDEFWEIAEGWRDRKLFVQNGNRWDLKYPLRNTPEQAS